MEKKEKVSLVRQLQMDGGFSIQQCSVFLEVLDDTLIACARENMDIEVGSLFDIRLDGKPYGVKISIKKKTRFSERLKYYGKKNGQ